VEAQPARRRRQGANEGLQGSRRPSHGMWSIMNKASTH
jgi:hypothetical protein